MNWITINGPPKITRSFSRREVPREPLDNAMIAAPMLFHAVVGHLNVCPSCGHHMGICGGSLRRRCLTAASSLTLRSCADGRSLQFATEEISTHEAAGINGRGRAMLVPKARLGRTRSRCAQDFQLMGGSWRLCRATRHGQRACGEVKAPLILFSPLGRGMQEGYSSSCR